MRPSALLLPVIVTIGCAETTSPAGSMPAPRHAGAWQQFCEQARSVPQANQLVGVRGADGWELVAMYNGVLCYKRPAPPPMPVAPSAPVGPSPSAPFVPLVRDPGF